jgi:hypothetical protein
MRLVYLIYFNFNYINFISFHLYQIYNEEEENEMDESKNKMVSFKLLSRNTRGKIEARELLVPEENKIAVKLLKSEETIREERQRVKDLVLQFDAANTTKELTYALEAGQNDSPVDSPQQFLSHEPSRMENLLCP